MSDPLTLALLALTSIFSSAMSAVAAIGGGSVLIAVLLIFFAPAQAIPFHGMVQLVGTFSRIVLLWRHIAWPIVWRVTLFMPVGATLGMWLFQGLPTRAIELAIGGFVLLSLFTTGRFRLFKARDMPLWGFFPVGILIGMMSVTVAVVAMFSGPFMMRKDLNRQAINVTMAALASVGHVTKVAAFGVIGFNPLDYLLPFAVMLPAIVLGTYLGQHVLNRMSERVFRWIFRVTLGGLALKLILWDGLLQPYFHHLA